MSAITINGNTFDPQVPVARTRVFEAEDAVDTDYIIVQAAGDVIVKDDKKTLADKGVEIQEYVGNNTYICRYPGKEHSDLKQIRDLSFVQYANVYLPQFVVQPSLKRPAASGGSKILNVLTEDIIGSRDLRKVDVILHENATIDDELKAQIAAAAHAGLDAVKFSGNHIQIKVQQDYLQAIAKIDAVRYIQEALPLKLHNDVARKILNADVFIGDKEYKGEGQIVAVADTGFDLGEEDNVPAAFKGRVEKLYALGRPKNNKKDDPDGHGTHVCGSVLGDAVSDRMGGRIEAPASKARLIMQSTLDSNNGLGGIPSNLEDLFIEPYNDGARVHVNSWGSTWQGFQLPYDAQSRSIDKFIWEHQELVITFAAGNDAFDGDGNGIVDPRTIGSQAAAKNCITVGATENMRPDIKFDPPPWEPNATGYTYGQYFKRDYPVAPVATDHMANKPQGIAAFSSRGPSVEGRIKPDVVAPGTAILSARSRAIRKVETFYGKSTDDAWWFLTGTSMANPLVGGCCAVLRETLEKNKVSNPSAALIKALLINGAEDITGQYKPTEAGPVPNGNEGFGRVNLSASVIIPGKDKHAGAGDEEALGQEDEWKLSEPIVVPQKRSDLSTEARKPGSKDQQPLKGLQREHDLGAEAPLKLKVTLVYTDPPGRELQNNLNLIVIGSRSERHGNAGARSFPIGSPQGFDNKNNVEQVVWDEIPAGETITIKVKAQRIAVHAQPFAYAWKIF